MRKLKYNFFTIAIFCVLSFLIYKLSHHDEGYALNNTSSTEEIQEVVIYSARKEVLLQDLLDNFTASTGIKVKVIHDTAAKLLAKLEQEADLSPADILITSDVAGLYEAKSKNLLEAVNSEYLSQRIPAHLKDNDNKWFAFTKRVRAIFYNKSLVNPEELSTYEALADEKWRNKILVRSSSNSYNQSLIASLISADGEENTYIWLENLVKNFARSPQGGDTDQLVALAAGEGHLAIANSYYFGRMVGSDDPNQVAMSEKIGIFFPNQQDRGAHVNVSGGAMLKNSHNRLNAIKLLEYMATDAAQELYAENNKEYPVVEGIKISPIVANWGEFKEDLQNLGEFSKFTRLSLELADKAGWR